MYIYKLPYGPRKAVVDSLNMGDSWRDLGGLHLGYSHTDLERFRRALYSPGDSPADALLTHWGQKNHTVLELFKHLHSMGNYQAMDAIKEFVPDKYKGYLTTQRHVTSNSTAMKHHLNPTIPAPPPVEYNKNSPNFMANMDTPVEKEYYKLNKQGKVDDTVSSNNHKGETKPREEIFNWNVQCNATAGAMNIEANLEANLANMATSPGTGGAMSSSRSKLNEITHSRIPNPNPDILLRNVPFEELALACDGFNRSQNLLGKGGFGEVYRGKWQGQDVAVKRIKEDKRVLHDADYQRYVDQAITELQALHIYPAENVLPLLAFSYSESMVTDPCLVYLYMPNGSVSDRLKRRGNTAPLTWTQRVNIALGTARGLCHLHANNIIHGDIKSGNILLDKHLEPKIGDFGLARGGPENDALSYKTVSIVQGTAIYLPDDYKRSRQLTVQVDTFCFGIFMFELVTGKSPSWTDPISRDNIRDMLIDAASPEPWVDKTVDFSIWSKLLFLLGRDCTKKRRKDRPSMNKVLTALEQLSKSSFPLQLQLYYDDQNRDKKLLVSNNVTTSANYNNDNNDADDDATPKQTADLMEHQTPEPSGAVSAISPANAGIPTVIDESTTTNNIVSESVELVEEDSSSEDSTLDEISMVLEDMDQVSLPMLSGHLQSLAKNKKVKVKPSEDSIPVLPDLCDNLNPIVDPLAMMRLQQIEKGAQQAAQFNLLDDNNK